MTVVIGIDPGLKGGIAVLEDSQLKRAEPLPIFDKKVNVHELQLTLGMWFEPRIAVELQGLRPNQSGALTLLGNFGRIMAIIELGGYVHTVVTPALWNRQLGIPAGLKGKAKKEAAYAVALRVFGLKRLQRLGITAAKDGLVEAALIAHWMA